MGFYITYFFLSKLIDADLYIQFEETKDSENKVCGMSLINDYVSEKLENEF